MQKLVMILSALCGVSAPAVGQHAQPQVILMFPEDEKNEDEYASAIVIPAGSSLRVTFPEHPRHNATFSGRLTLTGTYELKGYGDDAWVTLWPDSKAQATLPYWRNWWEGRPTEISLENGWAFAQAVVGKNDLHRLKADEEHSVRGQITIIVDEYQTIIECDSAHYSARFVSVVGLSVQMAANPPVEEEEEQC